MAHTLIMSAERVRRTLRRLAYEIIERNEGANTLELFGILDSGRPLADALAEEINTIAGSALAAHDLDVTTYRDDYPHDEEGHASQEQVPKTSPDITNRDVLLVDDVLFTGRTARAALDAVLQYGRPRTIQLVVLIDRGHREYPIQPDYTGRSLPTKHRERVDVNTSNAFVVSVVEP